MHTSRTIGTVAVLLSVALMGVGGAFGSPSRAAETLRVSASLSGKYQFGDYCSQGTAATGECVRFIGTGEIPGLGQATSTYTKILPGDDINCPVIQFNTAAIGIAGKGSLELSRAGIVCGPTAPANVGPLAYTVTRGTGAYAGVSGTLEFKSAVYAISFGCRCGRSRDTWTGTLTMPGAKFDVTAPSLTGATSKSVRVPRKAQGARVRYTVIAQDAVDGSVPATCVPRSGSFFRVGRTRVSCSATDSSANTTTEQFTVTVKRDRA